jgi:hypothetical protein
MALVSVFITPHSSGMPTASHNTVKRPFMIVPRSNYFAGGGPR